MKEENKPSQDDLLKAVADVLDEALLEYEKLTKGEGIDAAEAVDDMKAQGKGIVGEGDKGVKGPLQKEGVAPEPIKEEDKKDEDEDDEKLMQTYKSLVAKMEKRGLMNKTEAASVAKSETGKPAEEIENLRKSVDGRFESLSKAIKEVADTMKKIASTPAPRKGVAGYAPLKKSEEKPAATLKKSEIVNKLLDLKKSGTVGVDSLLINRVETGRVQPSDVERMKSLGILGE